MDEVLQLQEGTDGNGRKRCRAIKDNGQPCAGWVMKGFEYCFVHNPEVAEERHAARKLGGATNQAQHSPRVNLGSIPKKVRTTEDILELLDYCKDEMLMLNNSLSRDKAIAQLGSTYSQVIKDGSLEVRLDELQSEMESLIEKTRATRKR